MKTLFVILFFAITSAMLLSTAAIVLEEDADAIPAFARKHKVSCTTCHSAVPKLKAYGEEFAGNGFVFPEGNEPKRAFIDTGDERLMLQRDLPLAVRIDAYLRGEDSEAVDADLQTPYGIKLMSAGRIMRNISYYFYFYMYERGKVAGLEDAYIHFNNIGGINFDVMLGQFQVSDPLFKRELRLSYEDYLIYRFRPGFSRANLTYDRGLMLTYGFDFGLDFFGQLLNGNGIPDAGEDRQFDIDTEKASSIRLSQGLGPVRLGVFGYYNEERGENESRNNVSYAGGDATVGGEKWELNVQYLHREDSNPFFVAPDSTDTVTDGGFAEFVYMPGGDQTRWAFIALFNYIDSDGDLYDTRRATASVSHLPARNCRFVLEYTYDIEQEVSEGVIGVMAAF